MGGGDSNSASAELVRVDCGFSGHCRGDFGSNGDSLGFSVAGIWSAGILALTDLATRGEFGFSGDFLGFSAAGIRSVRIVALADVAPHGEF